MNILEKIDSFLIEKASPMRLIQSEIERMIENKPAKEQRRILDGYWIEMSKKPNAKAKWDSMNPTEKKSLTKWFQKMQEILDSGKQIRL